MSKLNLSCWDNLQSAMFRGRPVRWGRLPHTGHWPPPDPYWDNNDNIQILSLVIMMISVISLCQLCTASTQSSESPHPTSIVWVMAPSKPSMVSLKWPELAHLGFTFKMLWMLSWKGRSHFISIIKQGRRVFTSHKFGHHGVICRKCMQPAASLDYTVVL